MIEPVTVKLSAETLNQMTADKIIYAEYAPPGAMGNAGGALFYTITDDTPICYEADLDTDENVYARTVDFLRFNESTTTGGILRFYNGGAGNYVFINKNVSLKIADSYFIYAPDDKEYAIYSSVPGVFNAVVYALKRPGGL